MQPKADGQVKKTKAQLPKPNLVISPPTKLPTIRKRKVNDEKYLTRFIFSWSFELFLLSTNLMLKLKKK